MEEFFVWNDSPVLPIIPLMADTNYEFLDCGKGRRLERIGDILIDRPAPQADFPKKLPETLWSKAQAKFIRRGKENLWEFSGSDKMEKEPFFFRYGTIRMELRFSENGQIGIYPEQLDNWLWIKELAEKSTGPLRILNGFAYSGGSSLFASLGGKLRGETEVCHLDASKSAANWARKNAEYSSLKGQRIRFIVEDILRFMEREIKRGNKYHGLILDPPAFGRAPGKKTWVLKRDLPALMELGKQLMEKDSRFLLISCHDPLISKEELAEQLCRFPEVRKDRIETKDLAIPSRQGNPLPNGIAARWSKA